MTKHLVTFEVDGSTMFDMVAGMGDGGTAIGNRLAGVLLAPKDVRFTERVGMACYGIELKSVEAVEDATPNTSEA